MAAGTTALLLDHFLTATVAERTIFLNDALTCLGIADEKVLEDMRSDFARILDSLKQDGKELDVARNAWEQLKATVGPHTPFTYPERNVAAHYQPFRRLRRRIMSDTVRFVPAITVHQAKGREWRRVQVHLTTADHERLAQGLERDRDGDRILFVSLTRASHKCRSIADRALTSADPEPA